LLSLGQFPIGISSSYSALPHSWHRRPIGPNCSQSGQVAIIMRAASQHGNFPSALALSASPLALAGNGQVPDRWIGFANGCCHVYLFCGLSLWGFLVYDSFLKYSFSLRSFCLGFFQLMFAQDLRDIGSRPCAINRSLSICICARASFLYMI
jgi:hypothetical protein